MSRSLWAWTKSCAVGGARRSVGAVDSSQVQGHHGYGHLVRTISSLTPLIWVGAASIGMLTISPAALGSVGTPQSRPSTSPAISRAPQMYAAVQPNSRRSDLTTAVSQRPDAGAKPLAFGAGYATPSGSEAVRALQRRLAALGYRPGPIDGHYGPLTEAAVVGFQATHGLATDGLAGIHTLAAVAAAKRALYPGDGYRGNGSSAVRSLQRKLAGAGFSPGPIDGRYGPMTEGAVTRFQTARHLPVDGIAGPQTLDHLQGVRPGRSQPRNQSPARRPAPRTGTPPATARPGGAPHRANRNPRSGRAPKAGGNASPAVAGILITLLGALLLALLARQLWHRRGRDPETVPTGAPSDHRPEAATARATDETTAPATGVHGNAAEIAADPMAFARGSGGLFDQRTREENGDEQEGAAAFRLGLLLMEEGDRVGAEDAFRRADERGHAGAAFELGNLLVQEADQDGAKDAFRSADSRGHPGAAFDLAILLLRDGDRAGAKDALHRAEQRGHPDAAFDLGALMLQEGDLAGAEEAFRRADRLGDGGAACNLGVLLEQRGDLVGAQEAYERADERGHRIGACNLGALHEQQGDVVRAKAAYRRADERGDSAGAYHLGVLLEREGDRAAAKDAYRRADRRGHPEGAYSLGLLLREEGDRTAAVEALQRAGERGSPEVAEVARAALLELAPYRGGDR